MVQLLKVPFPYSDLFLRTGPAYSQALWKITGSANWIIWICQILRMWDYFTLQSTKHTWHTLITFFWFTRGSHQPLLTAHFLKIMPTLYDLIHLFLCFEVEEDCTLNSGFTYVRKDVLKSALSRFVQCFKAKKRLFCVSVSENQRMGQQTLLLRDLHRYILLE